MFFVWIVNIDVRQILKIKIYDYAKEKSFSKKNKIENKKKMKGKEQLSKH